MKNEDGLEAVPAAAQLNWKQLERYIRTKVTGLPAEPLQVRPFSAGYSNLTFSIRIGDWEAVLRCPPFGPIPPKAHDMEREYRILQRLHPVFPLAPKPLFLGDEPAIMARPFYVMERKVGVVLDDSLPPAYETRPQIGCEISQTVVNTLVQLHSINIFRTGLAEIGRTEGYLERQIQGWIKRYHQAKTDDVRVTDEIERWLTANLPRSPQPTVVHNDFKLNNMMLSPNNPGEAVAVFDWEMCTVGDPLTDLGSSLAYWTEAGEAFTGLTSVTTLPGFVSRREFVQLYAQGSGRDVSTIDFYLTFAFYKVAVILQQLFARWKRGEAQDDRFAALGEGIANLMQQSYRAMRRELL